MKMRIARFITRDGFRERGIEDSGKPVLARPVTGIHIEQVYPGVYRCILAFTL